MDDGSLTLLHSAELDVLYAHLLDDILQVVHSGLDLGVLLDVDGDFHLFALCGGSSLLFGRGSFLSRSSRLFHSSGSFRGSLFDDRLSHRSSLLLHNGSGLLNGGSRSCHRLVRQLDADADLGGSELQAQKTGLLGHFQHFVADVDVVLFHAQQSAGLVRASSTVLPVASCVRIITVNPPFCSAARSAGQCARPCSAQHPAGGHTRGGAYSSRWRRCSFPRPHRSSRP